MKTAIISITLLLLFFSNISFAQHFAPLRVGNTWVYVQGYNRLERCTVVNDSVLVDSLLYYELLLINWVPGLQMTRYVRMEGAFYRGKVTWFGGFEEIYYKKKANVGDIWYQEYDTVSYNVVTDSIVTTIWGKEVTLKVLEVNSMGLLVRYWEHWTEEYGKHLELDFWGFVTMQLYGCVIDGVVYGDTSYYTTAVEIENPVDVEYRLHQNYPNPFNPVTTIQYSISNEDYITLRIYNSLGEEIKTLVNEQQTKGNYSVNFNASNLPSGIYFYTLVAGNYRETKKMVLLK